MGWVEGRRRGSNWQANLGDGNATLGGKMAESVWKTDVTFVDTRKFELLAAPVANHMLVVFPNGTVWENFRAKVSLPCRRVRYSCVKS